MAQSSPSIVVVGAGVIGLSTAIALLSHPVSPYQNVTVIAKDLPSLDTAAYSPSSDQAAPSSYASAWAGAHHVSDAKDDTQLRRDKVTFDMLERLEKSTSFGALGAAKSNEALVKVHQTEYWQREEDVNIAAIEWYPDVSEWHLFSTSPRLNDSLFIFLYSPLQFKELPASALPKDAAYGCTLTTYDIVIPHYLPRLYQLFTKLGGKSICRRVESISEVTTLVNEDGSSLSVGCIIVSPGLGALELLGDKDVHPIRGQTVLVKAPWCSTDYNKDTPWASNSPSLNPPTWPGMSVVNKQGFRDVYIIPRGDGTFIVGGTRLVDDWDTSPREKTTKEILERVLDYMPTLAPPKHDQSGSSVDHLEVLGVNVGLRPARKQGVRLEAGSSVEGVPVIYSYGYGGYGYQCSWGAAFEARDLVDDALQRPRAPPNSTLALFDKDT
jgi:glycine/D-amino acid oxidase-like deaminating enzyme